MPVQNGFQAAKEIRAACPDARMIALTVHAEETYVLAALEAGFRGYALKSQASSQLLRAIQDVADGRVYLSPSVQGVVVDGYLGKIQLAPHPLTPRELEVLQLVAEGRSTKQIADTLGISAKTAESHRKRVKGKLRIHDTAGLVRYAIRQGIVEA
jgi:DNA-binding NarL/FixJ family response regulator